MRGTDIRMKRVLVAVGACMVCVVAFLLGVNAQQETCRGRVVVSRAIVTAAHWGDFPGYTCVYTDEATDYAVYVKDVYEGPQVPSGARVHLAGTVGDVVSTSSTEFAVDVENISMIVPGVSGEPVYWNSVPIGFISGWNGAGAVRCIFY